MLSFIAGPAQAKEFRSPQLEGATRELEDKDIKVEVYSENLSYNNKTQIYQATSYVEIKYGKFHLKADRATYNNQTGEVTAVGNVVIDEEESRLTGDRIRMNVKSKQGEIENGAGFIAPYYYFTGKKIKREAEDIYSFEEGSYTACDQAIPDWRLEAKKGRIHIENYATLSHALFYTNRIPIFYVPYAVFPVKTKRATGFLLPELGTSDRSGFFVRNAFFWAPSDWLDLTFNADYYTKLGFGGGGQFRAALSKEDRLRVSNFFIREQAESNDDRWEVAADLEHTLPLGIDGLGRMNLTSDKDYYRDYAHRSTKGQGWKKVNEKEKWRDEQRSFYSLTRNWSRLSLNNTVEYTRDTSNRFELADERLLDHEQTLWKYPDFSLSAPPQQIPYTPLFFQMESGYLGYEKKTELDFPDRLDEEILRNERLDAHPQITLPWSPAPYVTFTPRAGYRQTWWKEDEEMTNHDREIFNLGFLVEGPEVYRIFQSKEGGARYKHLIRPAVEYQFIPNYDQSNILQFDEVDNIAPVEEVDFSLTQQLLHKEGSKGGYGDVLDLVNFKISESFSIREAKRHHRLIQDKRQPWSPLKGELEVRLWDYLYIDADIQYNVYHLQIDSRNYSLRIADPGWWHATAGHRWKRDRVYSRDLGRSQSTFTDTFQGGAGINFWKKLLLNGSGVYNFDDDLWVEQEYSIQWLSQCWSFKLNFLRNYNSEIDPAEEDNFVIEREDVFYFTLDLYSLDTIHF
jgi:LPS-assembly protein